jgi:hypothetical protein
LGAIVGSDCLIMAVDFGPMIRSQNFWTFSFLLIALNLNWAG